MTVRARQDDLSAVAGLRASVRRERLRAVAVEPDGAAWLLAQLTALAASNSDATWRLTGDTLHVATELPAERLAAGVHRLRGQLLRTRGKHAAALDEFDAARQCAERAGDDTLALKVQVGAIDSLAWLGRFDTAVELGHRLTDELNARDMPVDAARALVNVGNQYFRRDEHREALDCYERAVEPLHNAGAVVDAARVESNCANILALLNRMDEAGSLFDRAREVFDDAGLQSASAWVDANQGYNEFISGRHAVAIALLNRAREVLEALGQPLDAAKCDADLGDVYRELNLLPEARQHYTAALRRLRAGNLRYEEARVEFGLAAVDAAGRRRGAMKHLESADSIFRSQRNKLQRAYVSLLRATVMRSAGRVSASAIEADRAARGLLRAGMPGLAAEARFLVADAELCAGKSATLKMARVAADARRYRRPWLESRACRAIGSACGRTDPRRAAHWFRRAIAALETARTLVAPDDLYESFSRDKMGAYVDCIALLLERGRPRDLREALHLLERSRSRALAGQVHRALQGADGAEAEAARDRLAALRVQLARAFHAREPGSHAGSRRTTQEGAVELAGIEADYIEALRDAQALAARAGVGIAATVDEADLRAALAPDECLVEYFAADGDVSAFVVTAGSTDYVRCICRCSDVDAASRQLRYQLRKMELGPAYVARHQAALLEGVLSPLAALHECLTAPVQSRIPGQKVTVIPYGNIHGLPFHAFFDGERYLADRLEVAYAPSAWSWFHGASRARAERARPLGNAALFGVPGPGVENAVREVHEIHAALPKSTVYCDTAATVTAFRREAESADVLHIATHALHRADNPMFSGFKLADGWVLAGDMYEMRLRCRLAVLSACQTGVVRVGAGDELFGLLRSFLVSGARSIAASFWPAHDEATCALMTAVYRHLGSGSGRADALRRAQMELRKQYPHPYHWAAFGLIGER